MTTPQAREAPAEEVAEGPACYHCQAPVDEADEVCPECGRRQYRVCYCAERIRADLPTCPHCEADWSESGRVRKTRRKSRHGSLRGFLRSAALGGVAALLVLGLLYYLSGRLAQHMTAADEPPASLTMRLAYAWQALSVNFTQQVGKVWRLLGNGALLRLCCMFMFGALVGGAAYAVQHGRWAFAKISPHKRQRRRHAD